MTKLSSLHFIPGGENVSGINSTCFSHLSETQMLSFESDELNNEPAAKRFHPSISNQIQTCVANALRHKTPFSSIQDSLKIMNDVPGAMFKLPTTPHKIDQATEPIFNFRFHYFCEKCQSYSVHSNSSIRNQFKCTHCDGNIFQKPNNYFITIPLKQQLENSIAKNWKSIIRFRDENENELQYIQDIHDGSICKQIDSEFANSFNLSVLVNTDGAQMFKSTKNSLWPIQLIQNFLPPRLRYICENIIVVGLYFGSKKPDESQIFAPLVEEIKDIHKAGGFRIATLRTDLIFLPFITHCTCDLPAKAMCQGIMQFNGKNACGYCHHPGELCEGEGKKKQKSWRYVRQEMTNTLRSHANTEPILLKLKNGASPPILGFKESSVLLDLPNFDIIKGFTIDYMHCVLLGTTRKMVSLWLDSQYWQEPYHIKATTVLNDRIKSIRPPSLVCRRPRPIDERAYYTANDWKFHLFFYLPNCLDGLLNMRYIDHFTQFSAAIYTLAKEKISITEIEDARAMLVKFADEFEKLYGKSKVTMNIHLLRHLADAVTYSGPLWTQSMFAFEQSNGELLKSVNGQRHALQQIVKKYILRQSLITKREQNCDVNSRYRKKGLAPTAEEATALRNSGITINDQTIFCTAVDIKGEKFTSTKFVATSSMDYFVAFSNTNIGKIKYYVEHNNEVYAVTENFVVTRKKFHLMEVASEQQVSVINIDKIEEKLIYVEIGNKKIVSRVPNRFEKA